MAKTANQIDILVIGEHPATYLAAVLLQTGCKLRVAHCTTPGYREADRAVLINPEFFELDAQLHSLRRKLEMTGIYGLQFLGDDGRTRSEFRSKSILGYVAGFKSVRAGMVKLAEEAGVSLLTPRSLEIEQVDETGLYLLLGKENLHARALILGCELPPHQGKMLGLPDGWGRDVVHRYTYIRLPASRCGNWGSRPMAPMSLNLRETLCWGWLLPAPRGAQLAVEQPVETVGSLAPNDLLQHWCGVLHDHGVLTGKVELPLSAVEWVDLPLSGALMHEGVANRTLLIGPAGGFYSACAEDIYPNCWSALFAVDAMKKALREPHLQDALQPYRQKWRTTLGAYLRGPQQNLRFLLPLVYRNQKMTTRLTESILQGKSVVR